MNDMKIDWVNVRKLNLRAPKIKKNLKKVGGRKK